METETREATQDISQPEAGEQFQQMVNLPANRIDATVSNVSDTPHQAPETQGDVAATEAGNIRTEHEYKEYLNDRLLNAGCMLDAARSHINSAKAEQEWFDLKQVVAAVFDMNDVYQKVDAVIEIENAAYEFARKQGATQAEYAEAVAKGSQATA